MVWYISRTLVRRDCPSLHRLEVRRRRGRLPTIEREDLDSDHVRRLTAVGDVLDEDDEPLNLADRPSLAGVVIGEFADRDRLDIADVDRRFALLRFPVAFPGPSLVRGATADAVEQP